MLGFKNIAEATVFGEKNPILGNIICAKVKTKDLVDEKQFINELKTYCRSNLKKHEVPIKIKLVEIPLHGSRFKKVRQNN